MLWPRIVNDDAVVEAAFKAARDASVFGQRKMSNAKRVVLRKRAANEMLRYVKEGQPERGTNFTHDFSQSGGSGNVVYADISQPLERGGADSIQLNIISPVEGHTHPTQNCAPKRKTACGVGAPSGTDMTNIFTRAQHGNKLHVVFAHEGIYGVSVKDSSNTRGRDAFISAYDELTQRYQSTMMTYEDFVKSFHRLVDETRVFKVDFVPVSRDSKGTLKVDEDVAFENITFNN